MSVHSWSNICLLMLPTPTSAHLWTWLFVQSLNERSLVLSACLEWRVSLVTLCLLIQIIPDAPQGVSSVEKNIMKNEILTFFPTCGLTSFLICPDSLPVLTVHLHFLPRYSQRNLLNSEIAGEKKICRQISISTATPPTACFTSSQYFSGLRKVLFCSFQSYIIEHSWKSCS